MVIHVNKTIVSYAALLQLLVTGCTYTTNYQSYEKQDEDYVKLGLDPAPALPQMPVHDLVAGNLTELNHDVLFLGTFCSAHKFKNEFSNAAAPYFKALDLDGNLSTGIVHLEPLSSLTTVRCFSGGGLSMNCVAKVETSIKITSGKSSEILESAFEQGAKLLSCGKIQSIVSNVSQQTASDLALKIKTFDSSTPE